MRYPTKTEQSFSSMRNALRLLNLFTLDVPELNLSQIAEKLEVGNSTAYRLASTLVQEGFLVKDSSTMQYRLSSTILGMGSTILSQIPINKVATLTLEKLVQQTGETSHLSILKGNQVVYLNKFESGHPVHLLSHAGRQNPAYCTSSGQVILSYQEKEVIDKVIEIGLTQYTSKTITSPAKMRLLLAEIKKQGYSVSEEEIHDGVSSIAAPIKDITGKVMASVSIAGPTTRINRIQIPKLIKYVTRAAQEISERLIFNVNNLS